MVVALPDVVYGIPFVFVFALLIYAAIAAGRKKRWKLAWTIYAVGLVLQLMSIASLIFFSPGGTGSLFPTGKAAALRALFTVWQDTGNQTVFVTPGRMLSAMILSAVIAVAGAAVLILIRQKKKTEYSH